MPRMTKPFIAVIGAIAFIFISTCATTGSGAGLSLMDAIGQTGEKIAGELPKGSRVAIVAFESVNDKLSDYIMEELTGELFDRGIEVADRQNLEYVYKELNLQMSGDVSDESAKSIGKFLAADMVITGQLIDLDGVYRYRTSAINVETAVRASVTRLDVRSDNATRRMINAISNQQTTTKVAKYGVSADITPQTAGTFLDRGILFASRGDYDMAIADFTEAIRIEPNMSTAYMLRGRALHASVSKVTSIFDNFSGFDFIPREGNISAEDARVYDRSLADFTQALRLDPNNALIYHGRANVYLDKGDNDKAITDLTQVIRLEPNDAQAYFFRGTMRGLGLYGDKDGAIADLTQAIRIDPDFHQAYAMRGLMRGMKDDNDGAIADFETSLRINPNDDGIRQTLATAYYRRGNAYASKGDFDRAIADFEAALRIRPNDDNTRQTLATAYFFRGRAYSMQNDDDRAIADFTQTIRLNPNHAGAYNFRAAVYYRKGDLDRAIADLDVALRINPNDADARQRLEMLRRQRGR